MGGIKTNEEKLNKISSILLALVIFSFTAFTTTQSTASSNSSREQASANLLMTHRLEGLQLVNMNLLLAQTDLANMNRFISLANLRYIQWMEDKNPETLAAISSDLEKAINYFNSSENSMANGAAFLATIDNFEQINKSLDSANNWQIKSIWASTPVFYSLISLVSVVVVVVSKRKSMKELFTLYSMTFLIFAWGWFILHGLLNVLLGL